MAVILVVALALRGYFASFVATELDPRDYHVALARAEADLAQARANLEAQDPRFAITEKTQETGRPDDPPPRRDAGVHRRAVAARGDQRRDDGARLLPAPEPAGSRWRTDYGATAAIAAELMQ